MDKSPTTTPRGIKRTFEEVIESDTVKTNNYSVVTMVARSGSGKIASVVNLASKHFIIYATCMSENHYEYPKFTDPNFGLFADDVT
ncbi:hypothetical protein BC937DRAFT_89556 [Endogone sp. FLAS-F59071]|nr:hypothetical protein BC937DRAFT_89556 [Endogone sp. FLAS-F59071]|eukprot:RUS17734.1 hypothetical protein BC937DRAFT_89556 [Endogone sp. FLAS-F59071]